MCFFVDFDQCLGAGHTERWSKHAFLHFLHEKHKKKEKEAYNEATACFWGLRSNGVVFSQKTCVRSVQHPNAAQNLQQSLHLFFKNKIWKVFFFNFLKFANLVRILWFFILATLLQGLQSYGLNW